MPAATSGRLLFGAVKAPLDRSSLSAACEEKEDGDDDDDDDDEDNDGDDDQDGGLSISPPDTLWPGVLRIETC